MKIYEFITYRNGSVMSEWEREPIMTKTGMSSEHLPKMHNMETTTGLLWARIS